jgi:ribosomal protein L11 methyltransferase
VRVLELRVPIADAELAADRLWSAGAQAVEEVEPDDGMVCLRTVLAADDDQSAVRLGSLGVDWTLKHVDVDDEPAQTWREFATPMEISPTLMIAPAWQPSPPAVLGRLTVVIEPGSAFGLGDHPTTRLSAAAAERLSPTGRVLDVGCGTGVLAIIAALGGAASVVAIDIAETAVEATLDNARRNGVESVISVSTTPIGELEGHFDLVLANVLAPALVAMAPHLRRVTSPSGSLVVSGVLADGYEHVVRSLEPMVVERVDVLDGWAAVELEHPQLEHPQLDRPGQVAGTPP